MSMCAACPDGTVFCDDHIVTCMECKREICQARDRANDPRQRQRYQSYSEDDDEESDSEDEDEDNGTICARTRTHAIVDPVMGPGSWVCADCFVNTAFTGTIDDLLQTKPEDWPQGKLTEVIRCRGIDSLAVRMQYDDLPVGASSQSKRVPCFDIYAVMISPSYRDRGVLSAIIKHCAQKLYKGTFLRLYDVGNLHLQRSCRRKPEIWHEHTARDELGLPKLCFYREGQRSRYRPMPKM